LIKDFQALFGNVVGFDVIDADLKMLKPRIVQGLDPSLGEEIAVRDHAGDHAAVPNVADDLIELRMQQRFTAADGDDARAQLGQEVEAAEHSFHTYGLRRAVILIAITAGKVAAPGGNDMSQDRMRG